MDQPKTVVSSGWFTPKNHHFLVPILGLGPLANGRNLWLINGGDPSYLLNGMILPPSNELANKCFGCHLDLLGQDAWKKIHKYSPKWW